MKIGIRKLILTASCLLATTTLTLQAQDNKTTTASSSTGGSAYKTGIGLRFGWEGGLTLKHFIREDRALEGIISRGWGYGGFRITGLYEFQKPFATLENLSWYAGLGAHVGFYNGSYYGYYSAYGDGYYDKNGNWHPGYRSRYVTFGVDGILGLEYAFDEVPFSVSLDIKPYFDFVGRGDRFGDGALSIRYLIR
jgi:hypothetical protein